MRPSATIIEFMLYAIKEALLEVVQTGSTESVSTEERRWYQIERFLKENRTISNSDVWQILGVSAATVNRVLVRLAKVGKIQTMRIGKFWDTPSKKREI